MNNNYLVNCNLKNHPKEFPEEFFYNIYITVKISN